MCVVREYELILFLKSSRNLNSKRLLYGLITQPIDFGFYGPFKSHLNRLVEEATIFMKYLCSISSIASYYYYSIKFNHHKSKNNIEVSPQLFFTIVRFNTVQTPRRASFNHPFFFLQPSEMISMM